MLYATINHDNAAENFDELLEMARRDGEARHEFDNDYDVTVMHNENAEAEWVDITIRTSRGATESESNIFINESYAEAVEFIQSTWAAEEDYRTENATA